MTITNVTLTTDEDGRIHLDHPLMQDVRDERERQRQEAERRHQEERRQRMLDPVRLAEWEEGIELSTKDLLEGVIFHLADLLALSAFVRHSAESSILRGIRLLKPLATHSRQVRMILDRLAQVNGSTEHMPADYLAEDSHDMGRDVLIARLRERQSFLTSSVLSDLKNQKKWVAEAKRVQRKASDHAKPAVDPSAAA